MTARCLFDEAYYHRFYLNPETSVSNDDSFDALSDFLFSYLNYLDQPVDTVIDIGCGLGEWRDAVLQHHPQAHYLGVEVSEYACKKYGWVCASVVDYTPSRRADLAICSDVLQYLDDISAIKALDNLGQMTTGALFFAVLTEEDWLQHCDQDRTDANAYLRPGNWYRTHLNRHFTNAGGGLFIHHNSPVVLYDLEKLR